MRPVAIPADLQGRRTSNRGGGPSKLGDTEKPSLPPTHLRDDPGTHESRRVRRVPDKNRTGDDGYLTTLQGGHGHGAALAGVSSGLGTVPLHPGARLGERLTPSTIIEALLSEPEEYEAIRLFCERVMLAKERAERERKRNSHP